MSDGHNTKVTENPLNENWKDFKKLWERINKRYAYTCEFDGAELIKKSIEVINIEPRVAKLPYTLTKGEQEGTDFNIEKTETKNSTGHRIALPIMTLSGKLPKARH